ncbi:hypothetical protein pEaSNUABM50_00247 [Erwinia phage pEa_SNUABM_50]|uniref:Uncharacterized protein n=4 Tax=Eneladusvirus BF TaxID=2560751 RepID=A0A7L8ZNG8_9CAUD|nr:hypothetical protein FDH34_gp251 [Serratia phage BF]QOI71188.1 hypothetical protein pEaSNUABM12_00250 [Erwinia phage pEa_SNUABM_12]QOI71732.1 hypothetical protein pEaSNUABM47_00248 [Erwinia phage pEa_SNUABM_47]QOI72271.1 hypothetical protein pEaSNUABM50_00247 [Erwinia phage pEa_SNUABM_50]QXO11397.1 hypothetical protein pEaSNUABM19_00251 [Erwinia phage pEa_SNUABM_19]QXO11945.1 hypothetical protein pEaSNUABM44_00249 [Erwinia phage pEa_SNUABM_44]QXO12498.1 hypothetical protein pEaSNUABM49_002
MLDEIFEAKDDSMYDPEDDQTVYKLTDTRKPKLTLQILNNLRKYREFKKNEAAKRDAVVAIVYAQPSGDDQAGGGMM